MTCTKYVIKMITNQSRASLLEFPVVYRYFLLLADNSKLSAENIANKQYMKECFVADDVEMLTKSLNLEEVDAATSNAESSHSGSGDDSDEASSPHPAEEASNGTTQNTMNTVVREDEEDVSEEENDENSNEDQEDDLSEHNHKSNISSVMQESVLRKETYINESDCQSRGVLGRKDKHDISDTIRITCGDNDSDDMSAGYSENDLDYTVKQNQAELRRAIHKFKKYKRQIQVYAKDMEDLMVELRMLDPSLICDVRSNVMLAENAPSSTSPTVDARHNLRSLSEKRKMTFVQNSTDMLQSGANILQAICNKSNRGQKPANRFRQHLGTLINDGKLNDAFEHWYATDDMSDITSPLWTIGSSVAKVLSDSIRSDVS